MARSYGITPAELTAALDWENKIAAWPSAGTWRRATACRGRVAQPSGGTVLGLVGYPITLVDDIAEFAGVVGIKDEQLIPWMGRYNPV